jgi:hypothetical protein
MLNKTSAFGEIQIETRLPGEVFRPFVTASVSEGHSATQVQSPYIIISQNTDIRMRAATGANDKDISGWICGALMKAAS